jgi:acyl-coenzyme A thioesterase PaaI-like protein
MSADGAHARDIGMSAGHFIAAIGMRLSYDGERVLGAAEVHPEMWATGTRRVRMGVLAAMVDIIGGHVPHGPHAPTIDLRVQRTGPSPEQGAISLTGTPLRVGRQIIAAETTLADATGRTFAIATTAFVNQPIGWSPFTVGAIPHGRIESFDRLVGARALDARTLELAPKEELGNGRVGTVQGGVQAFLAELAAERVCAPGAEVVDLHIRFVDRMRVGPLHARAEVLGRSAGRASVRVELVDAGDGGRRVSAALLYVSETRSTTTAE